MKWDKPKNKSYPRLSEREEPKLDTTEVQERIRTELVAAGFPPTMFTDVINGTLDQEAKARFLIWITAHPNSETVAVLTEVLIELRLLRFYEQLQQGGAVSKADVGELAEIAHAQFRNTSEPLPTKRQARRR